MECEFIRYMARKYPYTSRRFIAQCSFRKRGHKHKKYCDFACTNVVLSHTRQSTTTFAFLRYRLRRMYVRTYPVLSYKQRREHFVSIALPFAVVAGRGYQLAKVFFNMPQECRRAINRPTMASSVVCGMCRQDSEWVSILACN